MVLPYQESVLTSRTKSRNALRDWVGILMSISHVLLHLGVLFLCGVRAFEPRRVEVETDFLEHQRLLGRHECFLALLHPPVSGPLVFHPTTQRPGELGDQGVAVFFFERQQLSEAVVPGLSLERLHIGGFSGPENESNLNEIILRRVR